jgi:hypothetical protein
MLNEAKDWSLSLKEIEDEEDFKAIKTKSESEVNIENDFNAYFVLKKLKRKIMSKHKFILEESIFHEEKDNIFLLKEFILFESTCHRQKDTDGDFSIIIQNQVSINIKLKRK